MGGDGGPARRRRDDGGGREPGAIGALRIYQAYLTGADDVTDEATLGRPGLRLAGKRLLVDLGRCPSFGATSPGTRGDNVEGMVLGAREPSTGFRELRLVSDDNFSAGQVTRLYRLRVRLRGEPVLEARATYDALKLQPGPPSGQTGVTGANGVTPPFPSQPIPGFSALLSDGDRGLLGMPDNGFGAKGNSADFLLRVYRVRPAYASGTFDVDGFISLRDPDRLVPFPIVNEATPDRLLTGRDFDLESLQGGSDGSLWFGEEFGPFLLNTSADGRVLRAPVPLPGVKSPQSPDLAPGETPNLPASRGFEATAASPDERYLYPILEGALTTEADQAVRRVYEFDTTQAAYTGRSWSLRLRNPSHVVGDAQVLDGRRLVFIERDNAGGPAAEVKRLVEVDLDAAPLADSTQPTRPFLDLLRIRDPRGVSLPAPAGAFGLGDPFEFPFVSVESVLPLGRNRFLLTNDNNFPGNDGRIPGRPDDLELIIVRAS